ncbi:osmotic avoidance abnormal protein 3 [Phlebotomus argentipes]|uniref:osmotic avoidance abnormal protein 3 n=1 Tax=Phlebotomus argentipes TaxID=94469 RepID=UPI002893339A|nr:osmotic avoidance abnormal protein 3 [Phlebotomus argentipes]
MAENVRVVVRCRPAGARECGKRLIVTVEECTVVLENATDAGVPQKVFRFDGAYGPEMATEVLYNDVCFPVVEGCLEGFNGTIFAYGQTGCGKSFTMGHGGVTTRALEHLFEATAAADANTKYLILVSYLEIYNDTIRDLLATEPSPPGGLQLREMSGEVNVLGLSRHAVRSAMECEELLRRGGTSRVVGATLMNASSSRSHAVFTICIERLKAGIVRGKLNLVDLAGSERQSRTGAAGERLKEATKINLSLAALGNVISALAADASSKHVPYRDSKLTRLLQDSLGGGTRTLMIACIAPSTVDYEETLSTLRYASRAKRISNRPRLNEDPKDTMLRQYREEIDNLKALLEQADPRLAAVQAERDALARDIEALRSKPTQELVKSIAVVEGAILGGAADENVRARRRERQAAAQQRQAALVAVLARIEEREARDTLQGHYTDIETELRATKEALRVRKARNKALQREVNDLQAEFQLDRADYLDTIRRLERHVKLNDQLLTEAMPVLQRDGRQWDVEAIRRTATWSDDSNCWLLPEELLARPKLPELQRCSSADSVDAPPSPERDPLRAKLQRSDGAIIADTYFRSRRAVELLRPREAWHDRHQTVKSFF